MLTSPRQKNPKKKRAARKTGREPDDFVSVGRRLGADESKERFEAKLKKIAKVGSPKK